MKKMYDYAIIGGDNRMAYMGAKLQEKGFRVVSYGMDKREICPELAEAESLRDAAAGANVIIGPIPLTRNGIDIQAKIKKQDLTIEALKQELTYEHKFFAGCIPADLLKPGSEKQIFMYDYMKDEELTIYNTIATAEGAIAEALLAKQTNLHNSRCLILGYGRCGKTLAVKLKGLAAAVTVCARKGNVRAEADSCGFETLDFQTLSDKIGSFEYIFNTIPDKVMDRKLLDAVSEEVLVIDIASAPGGVDFDAAKQKGIQAKLCLGLPGIYAAEASAQAMTDLTIKYGIE